MQIDSTQKVLQLKAKLFADLNVPRVAKSESWDSIVEKVKTSAEHTVHVVDANNKLVGLITDQDVLEAISNEALTDKIKNAVATANDVMRPLDPEKTDSIAQSSESLEDVIAKLQGDNQEKRTFRALPLVDEDGTAVGQVTRESIQRNLDELLKE